MGMAGVRRSGFYIKFVKYASISSQKRPEEVPAFVQEHGASLLIPSL